MDDSRENLLSIPILEDYSAGERYGCSRCCMLPLDSLAKSYDYVNDFLKKALETGRSDPRKIIYGIKMGFALALASLLMFWEVSFTDLGQYSIWAIITVIVMFEYSIGSTFSKGFNRGLGTLGAGMLAFIWAEIAVQSGQRAKEVILISFFITGSIASYFKLYPSMAPYEYGYKVFIMTFCILMVAGNRSKHYTVAILTRLSLIALGGLICFIVNTSICPVWAGDDLRSLVVKNFEDLAASLEGCVDGYLKGVEYERIPSKIVMNQDSDDPLYKGYRSVLESKSKEQTLFGFAIWEPPHGRFKPCHWKSYVRLSNAVRHCAFTVMALHGCVMSEIQAPMEKRILFYNELKKVGAEGAKVLRKIGSKVEKMEKLGHEEDMLKKVHKAAEELQKIIDARSYQLVNTENWPIRRHPHEEDDDQEMEDQKNLLLKSHSETAVDLMRAKNLPATLHSSSYVFLKPSYEKQIPWPSPMTLDAIGLGKDDEIRTYESASAMSLATFASLLIEFVARIRHVVESFEDLCEKAEFKEPVHI
ncbi:OLC1v1032339C1 [Oldenlandia corymbosa var. corymbosa]|uniref:OLC1v1032339C1 n=1 Tax=Oldenlandia corymbosa var. corymbosa TaxID=529605 RepID=A0AAV1CM76_OLDCO|nr:OLC1v1032339C1 [Oldenlandia corymbosa var. corymbosa]